MSLAAAQAKVDATTVLLDANADINKGHAVRVVVAGRGMGGTHHNKEADALRLLVNAKADINKSHPRCGHMPAHVAANSWHHEEFLPILIEVKADMNKADDTGKTPTAVLAAAKKATEVARSLARANSSQPTRIQLEKRKRDQPMPWT